MSAAEITAVGVVGGGAWGTALAIHCARMGHKVTLWARESEVVEAVNGPARENSVFLRGHPVPDTMSASGDLAKVVATTKLLLVVVPTPFVAATLMPVADALAANDSVIVSCTKGILGETLETPDDILRRVLPSAQHGRLAYLSGPSFAAEVAKELPTVVTIAAQVSVCWQQPLPCYMQWTIPNCCWLCWSAPGGVCRAVPPLPPSLMPLLLLLLPLLLLLLPSPLLRHHGHAG